MPAFKLNSSAVEHSFNLEVSLHLNVEKLDNVARGVQGGRRGKSENTALGFVEFVRCMRR